MSDLLLTSAQSEASNRHDVFDVIYLLSGTLPGRGGVADQAFYWSTRTIVAPLGAGGADVTFYEFLAPPTNITKSFGFEPGEQATSAPIPVLVRNLPFAHSESIVAAFTDDDFALESASVTLRVAFVKPGDSVSDLVAADFTPLVLEGFFGAPTDVRLDGLTLPIYNRGAKRSMALKWPQLPEAVPYMDADRPVGGPGTGGNLPLPEENLGAYPPIIMGRPDGWYKPLIHSTSFRGRTVSGYSAGDTVVKVQLTTRGGDITRGITNGGTNWAIGHRWPQYLNSASTIDEETHVVTLSLQSGLAADVARGAYVQCLADETRWILAPHENYGGGNRSWPNPTDPTTPLLGWRLKNGEIKIASDGNTVPDPDGFTSALKPRYQAKMAGHDELADSSTSAVRWRMMNFAPNAGVNWQPVAYYDPSESLEVTQQASYDQQYTSNVSDRAVDGNDGNHPGANNALARDGNLNTGVTFGTSTAGDYFELEFPEAPAPFTNGSATRSILYVVCRGKWNFESEAGSTTYGQAQVGGAVNQFYTFQQAAGVQLGRTLRVEMADNSGGIVFDVYWDHNLEVTTGTEQDADAVVGTGVSVGETMVEADLVMMFPPAAARSSVVLGMGLAAGEIQGDRAAPAMRRTDSTSSGTQRYPIQRVPSNDAVFTDKIRPTQAMLGLHALLGKEGHFDYVDVASYDAAHQRFIDEDVRVNMLIEYEPSWFELERKMGENFRSHFFYGPSGHECHFIESESAIEASGISVRQTFRLPGCPAANCFTSTQPFMRRTSLAQLVNTAKGNYLSDYLDGGRTLTVGQQQNAASVAANGPLLNASKSYDLGWNNFVPYVSGAWNVETQVSGILQLYADRQAWARTRFTFETSWIALGVDRGSIIRVSYPVSFNPPSYRNNVAEVESITLNPLNSERYVITARSINKPQKGLDPAIIWTEVFSDDSDQWTTRISQEFDTWSDYWALPDS